MESRASMRNTVSGVADAAAPHPWRQWNPITPSSKMRAAMRATIRNHKYGIHKRYYGSKYDRTKQKE